MPPIPDSVWKSETQHRNIWRHAGLCVACGIRHRDLMCRFCMEPMCSKCLPVHELEAHARDKYIERLALSKSQTYFYTATEEEQMEALALRAKWADEEQPPKARSATA